MADETQSTAAREDPDSTVSSIQMSRRKVWSLVGISIVVFGALYLVQERNYLLFHSLAEMFAIVIASGVFLVAWNSRTRLDADFLLVLGVAYASVAFLDTIHTLSYAGMGVFPAHGANLPTQFWVAARYVEAGSIAVAAAFIGSARVDALVLFGEQDRDAAILIVLYLAVTAGLVGSIFLGIFPTAYIEGVGLTSFKIVSEYVIIGTLGVALGVLYRYRTTFEPYIFRYLGLSILLTMGAEVAFTQYASVYGLSNMIGHFAKIASFYLIYVAVIKTGIAAPQALLFRQLRSERDKLAEREKELERQNTQLDEFASIVSHDLRNPLHVARGQLKLAREEYDSEHLDTVAQSHDRMSHLIEDLLELARVGKRVSDLEPIDLEACIETSWQNVQTGTATLRTEPTQSVVADKSGLQQILENLFRNAVEHGSTGTDSPTRQDTSQNAGGDVTIRVGMLDDGFYVEDDGPGIPEDERDVVFEAGHSSNPDGTGFGLSIVAEVVDAHGWEILITEGNSGGARFEIAGVDVA